MFFSYWTESDHLRSSEGEVRSAEIIAKACADWGKAGFDLVFYNDCDVSLVLEKYWPEFSAAYSEIAIPACRADLARLLLLYEYGGVYVDAHVVPGNLGSFADIVGRLANYELVMLDLTGLYKSEYDIHPINGFLVARSKSEAIGAAISNVIANLIKQKCREAEEGFVDYNVYALSGSWALSSTFLSRPAAQRPFLKDQWSDKVCIVPLLKDQSLWPVQLYKNYGYRSPGTHWSERQKSEPLFKRPV